MTSHSPLRDPKGNPTKYQKNFIIFSHLLGLLQRTVKLLEHGIKPVWVFDGKPPEEKHRVSPDNCPEVTRIVSTKTTTKYGTVTLTMDMIEEMKKLLDFLGVPYVQAASEAESQCAALCKENKADYIVSEDMDSLAFGGKSLIRGMCNKENQLYQQIDLQKSLDNLGLTYDQFVDMCVLCGCDYSEKIDGIGPCKAYRLIKKLGDLESVAKSVREDKRSGIYKKFKIIIDEEIRQITARKLFKNPLVKSPASLKLEWNEPDEGSLIKWLVTEKGFNELKTRKILKPLSSKPKNSKQSHIEDFFKQKKSINSVITAHKKKKIKPKEDKKKKTKQK